jgi:hypothetical protein
MRKYEALAAITFKHGRFKLTADQLSNRLHVVTVVDKDERIVEPLHGISFKRGEIFETDVDMPKTLPQARPVEESAPAPSQASVPAAVGVPSVTATAADSAGSAPVLDAPAADEPSDDPLAHFDDAPPETSSEKPSGRKRK